MKISINGQVVGGYFPELSNVGSMKIHRITLFSNEWNDQNEQDVFVPGVYTDETKMQLIIPVPSDTLDNLYYSSGIKAVRQGFNLLTWKSAPSGHVPVLLLLDQRNVTGSEPSTYSFTGDVGVA